jgi:hypothetical protein
MYVCCEFCGGRCIPAGARLLHTVVSTLEECKFELYEIVLPANSLKTSLG